ncbi:MAG: hypothetical protein ACRDY7_17800 [Acidimicrobiia bacterium]
MQQAEAFITAAELVLNDDANVATPGVAAALGALAGIAASDAVCCTKLRQRPRGHNHREAVTLLRTVAAHGEAMANDLARLLVAKDESHYGLGLVNLGQARRLLGYAPRMTTMAAAVLAGS